MAGISTKDFFSTLYKNTSGALSITYLGDGGMPVTKWFTADQIEEMASYAEECGKRYNTSVNINPRKEPLDPFHRGVSQDISEVVGAYADLDIKGPAHAEKRLPLTEDEVYSFLKENAVTPSFIIFSGNGIQCYWLFKEPFQITCEAEREYIEAVLKGYERHLSGTALSQHGWHFDSVSDLARMLRVPGTTNFKTSDKPKCRVVAADPVRYVPEDFQDFMVTKPGDSGAGMPDGDAFAMMGTGSADELISKCAFLQYCRDEAANLPEPMWYAAISNLALTADGDEAVHTISSPYPKYTYRETEKKYRHAAEEDKPVTCQHIRDRLCFNCGKDCGVRAPIALIRAGKKKSPDLSDWEDPIPFEEYSLPEFPVDTLPPVFAEYCLAVAEHTQTPVDMAGTGVLAVTASCVQGKYVVVPKPGWEEQTALYCVDIMLPSERKSAVENEVVKPVNKYETEYNTRNAAAIEMSRARKRVLEERCKSLEGKARNDDSVMPQLESAIRDLTEFKEEKPLKLYVDDITTEKLVSVLAQNGGRMAILSTEGGIFDTLAGIYTKHVNIDVILKAYSGDAIRVDRIGRESESILRPTLTMLLMAQPDVLSGLMQNKTFRGRGLTARVLYSIPRSFVGKRRYRTEPIPDAVYRAYESRITNMLREEYPPEPMQITLSTEADQMIEAFAEELEPKIRGEYAEISDWAGKLVGNTLRIAGLLCRASADRISEFGDMKEALIIDGATMANAIRLAEYFTEHAKAAYSLMGADDTVRLCRYVLKAVKENGLTEFKLREIMRLCRSFKKAEDLQPVLDHLVDYGYIAPGGRLNWSGRGRPPAQTYLVNPRIYNN